MYFNSFMFPEITIDAWCAKKTEETQTSASMMGLH